MNQLKASKHTKVMQNVTFRVFDVNSGKLVKEYKGHNQATNGMLYGIARYLTGDGVLNQASAMLEKYIPKYISLGTMGLKNQESDGQGLPTGLESDFADHTPGYGADGYDEAENNNRSYFGLGPIFENRSNKDQTIDCELVSDSFPRAPITYREIIPEYRAELPESIDIIFSAMVSTGALAQFREPGKDYIFITEAGLWSYKSHTEVTETNEFNGLLAGYRLLPPNDDDRRKPEEQKKHILRVNKNQVVQVIWKIQLGSSRDTFSSKADHPCDCTCTYNGDKRVHINPDCPCHGGKEPEPTKTPVKIEKVCNGHALLNCELWLSGISNGKTVLFKEDDIQVQDKKDLLVSVGDHLIWKSENQEVTVYLPDGTYTLKENKAPEEYELADPITFTVANGKVTQNGSRAVNDNKITMVNIGPEPPEPPKSEKVFSEGTICCDELHLGARNTLRVDEMHIRNTVVWQSSDANSPGEVFGATSDSKVYFHNQTEEPDIQDGWNDYWNLPVCIPEGDIIDCPRKNGDCLVPHSFTPATEGNPNMCSDVPSEKCFFQGGIQVIPDTEPMPTIQHITDMFPSDDVNKNVIIGNNKEQNIAIMTPQHIFLCTKMDGAATREIGIDSVPLNELDTKISQYEFFKYQGHDYKKESTIYSDNDIYGAYHDIQLNVNGEVVPMLYVLPGKYAVNSISATGSACKMRFVSSPEFNSIFYVRDKIQFSNNPTVEDMGNELTWVLYCASDKGIQEYDWEHAVEFGTGTIPMKVVLVCPDGCVNITNGNDKGILHGSIYAKKVIMGNDITFGISGVK